jgi:hypothetical protein
MMKKRAVLLAVSFLLASTLALFALGDPEAGDYEPVEGLENWDHRVDISEYEEGKYNLIIRGSDAAGNLRYEGPYNVFVDPTSDLPLLRISSPTPGMRVGGSLNVVGVCLDDDAVQRVELQLDDGPSRSAEGTEFWSLRLDLEGLADGEHTIQAWGVDVNGVSGEPQSVIFQLDRRAPAVKITSHESGALVSGKVALQGMVEDANGVKELGYSRQRDGEYLPLKLSYDKAEQHYAYELRIETEELEDGPQVFWFRAEDATGSIAYMAFLLFVNNEEPALQILSPQPDETVHGRLLVVGKANDPIGLRSLSYEIGGGGSGQVELILGNPYWIQEFDLADQKAGALQISFTLENLTGNQKTEKLKVRLDPEGDKPRVEIAVPREGSQLADGFEALGYVRDDDGGMSVEYSVDGGEAKTVSAADAYRFPLEGLAPGRHSLSVRATDIHGSLGDAVKTQFTILAEPPRVALTKVTVGEQAQEYRPGITVPAGQKASLSGEIRGAAATAEYSLQGGSFRRLSLRKGPDPDVQLFDIPLGRELAPGQVDVQVRCTDSFGSTGASGGLLFYQSGGQAGREILFADARVGGNGMVRLGAGEPLFAYVPGGSIDSVVLDPPSDIVTVRPGGSVVRIEAGASGVSEPLRLEVSTGSGGTLRSKPLRFITDQVAPTIVVDEPQAGAWFADSVTIAGTVRDSSGVESLQYALGEGASFAALGMEESGDLVSFSASLPAGPVEDGPVILILRAKDAAGNTADEVIPLLRDSVSPVLTITAPGPEDELNGQITLVGRVEDAGKITGIEFNDDSGSVEIGSGRKFHHIVNLSSYETLPQNFVLKAVDAAGNEGTLVPVLNIDPEADKPVVEIQVPGEAEVIKNDFIISGMAFDDDRVGKLFYSLDGGRFNELPGGNNFSIPLSIESLSDNEHVVAVRAEDIGGLASEESSSTFVVSTSEPRSSLLQPSISQHVRGVIELSGKSEDPNGIAETYVSLDNGHSFQLMEGTEQWSYRLDTTLMGDGTHAVLIKAVDSTGTEGLYTTTINIDNGAPEIVLDDPADGEICTRTLNLDGRSVDNIGLTGLKARLIPAVAPSEPEGLDGGGVNDVEYELPASGIIVEQFDVTSLPAGWYNLSVEAEDAAGNQSYLSRNIMIRQTVEAERVELLYPLAGAALAGNFTLSGRVVSQESIAKAIALVDGAVQATVDVDGRGYFSLDLGPEQLQMGTHTLQIQAQLSGGVQLVSEQRYVNYRRSGAWVQITSHQPGAFVTGRPFLEGHAGYFLEELEPEDEQPAKKRKRELAGNEVQKIEISFDNGGSFERADGKDAWRYRLETQGFSSGPLRILVRAVFADGQTAVTRTHLQVDTDPPELVLLSPGEGGRFNQEISLRGTASDETGLESVEISLREGDKNRYGVPAFIQGLYLDLHAMGATYVDLGLGLTFFDDNVKLQAQVGKSPPGRFSGLVIGAKLLANVATVPFGYFFGPSWDFFSMSLALGANFSYFTMSEDSIAFTEDGLMMASVVGQLEFAKFEVADWRFFDTYSLYSEVQLWFISSDVEAGTAARLSFGFRLGLL